MFTNIISLQQQPGTPLGLQSPAGLPFPYFIPGLYPGPAGPLALSQADPFAAALQNTVGSPPNSPITSNPFFLS
jgi:hypothetical protein